MKKAIYFLVFLLPLLIFQGCSSLKSLNVGKLACAGKGVKVSVSEFIIKWDTLSQINESERESLKRTLIDQLESLGRTIGIKTEIDKIEECPCGDQSLLRVVLDDELKNKSELGELLTSITELHGLGAMNADPIPVQKQKPPKPSLMYPDANVSDFISTDVGIPIIAVLDSGINLSGFSTSELLLFKNPGGLRGIDDAIPSSGYNFIGKNTDIQDGNSIHGTLVTGKIIQGLKDGGVSYRILPLKISDGKWLTYWDLLCAIGFIKHLKDEKNVNIKLVNASLGFRLKKRKFGLLDILGISSIISPEENRSILKTYIDDFSNSALVVAAAGNKGERVDNNDKFAYYPATYTSSNLLVVGGLEKTDGVIGRHKSSNYGPISVDIAAPYEYPSEVAGTSIGTAKITGSLAGFLNQNTTLTPFELKTEFLANASVSVGLNGVIKDGKYEE